MGFQRALDFLSLVFVTTLVVRSLSREEYGTLSVVLGYGLFYNVLNVSVSSVLIRDRRRIGSQAREYMRAFLWFSVAKGAVAFLLTGGIGVLLYLQYRDIRLLGALALNAVSTALLFVAEPLSTFLSVEFRQSDLTRISLATSLTNCLVSIGVVVFPTALVVLAKNALVALVSLGLTAHFARKALPARENAARLNSVRILRESLLGFSVWSHLIGVVTDVIYRADLLILSWLGAPLRTVGNYNIALQLANFTKVAPQVLQYNATLALSHSDRTPERQDELTFFFVKYSFILSVAIMVGYAAFGRIAIGLLAGSDVDEVFDYGWFILSGLCLYNAFRPLISYGVVAHSIRDVFLFAVLPSGSLTVIVYLVMGSRWGAAGLAVANLVAGGIMTGLTMFYVHSRTNFRWRMVLVSSVERDLLARIRLRWRR